MRNGKQTVQRKWLAALLLPLSMGASAAGVHQHGLAEAAVVVEGGELTVTFTAPLMDILGTVQPPGDAAARVRYADQLARLTAPEPSPKADCKPVSKTQTTVDMLFPHGEQDHHDAHHEHEHDASPEHGHHDDNHGDDEAHGQHQDVEAEWTFVCQQPEALKAVTLPFLDTFSGLTTEVVLLLPAGQNALKLEPGNTRIPLE